MVTPAITELLIQPTSNEPKVEIPLSIPEERPRINAVWIPWTKQEHHPWKGNQQTHAIHRRQEEDWNLHTGMQDVPANQSRNLHWWRRQDSFHLVLHEWQGGPTMETGVTPINQHWRRIGIPLIKGLSWWTAELLSAYELSPRCCSSVGITETRKPNCWGSYHRFLTHHFPRRIFLHKSFQSFTFDWETPKKS